MNGWHVYLFPICFRKKFLACLDLRFFSLSLRVSMSPVRKETLPQLGSRPNSLLLNPFFIAYYTFFRGKVLFYALP